MPSALLLAALFALSADAADEVAIPEAVDSRLRVELFAAEPDVVTPCGIAVDHRGRVLVIESHSHFRPTDYEGPPADRIRLLEDRDGDGRAEHVTNFYEGTKWTMNLAVHPDGSVYVATRSEIFRLRDTDEDGRADQRSPIAHLETEGNYPHNGLSGFAFDAGGNVYFGMGENLGAEFTLVGSDGSKITQQEGGQVYRCTADGGRLEMIALGFWNPFHLAFDAFGRLLVVDNDPDSLPPCRLLHIVPGGNYGYRFRNGRKGVHPFTAWNGELPGTLPMVAGTGEAPSGIVAYESDGLPSDYVGDLLVTSWGHHRIERYRLEPRGASVQAVREDIVTGDENFRPVGIAVAPDGSLFVSDWVLKDYALHGKGRVWHITAAESQPRKRPRDLLAALHSAHRPLREDAARQLAASDQGQATLATLAGDDPAPRVRAAALAALAAQGIEGPLVKAARNDPSLDVRTAAIRAIEKTAAPADLMGTDQPVEVRAEAMRHSGNPESSKLLWEAVSAGDAFLAQAARRGLGRLHAVTADLAWAERTPAERLAAALILRESGDPAARAALPRLLADPDPQVRFAAVQWVGEEQLSEFREPLGEVLAAGEVTARLFGGYLAALEKLDGRKRESSDEWGGQQYVALALEDSQSGPEVQRWALRTLRPDHPALSIERLQQYLESDDEVLRLEAVRTLRDSPHARRHELLAQIASDENERSQLRAEAIVGLSPQDKERRRLLFELAASDAAVLRHEALRSLRGAVLAPDERKRLAGLGKIDDATAGLVQKVLEPAAASSSEKRDVDGWLTLLRDGDDEIQGDAEAGERIFFHSQAAACSRCHQIAGRGHRIGPELTATAGALSERRLVESIVDPSKEVAPQFVAWRVATHAGQTFVGTLVHEERTGEQTYADPSGKLLELAPEVIAERVPAGISVMPEGLPGQLTLQEFRDLVAYLRSDGGE
ncbi:MAG: hypothetical protein DWQ37_06855 [Planctomycetota bacterium]|nr:MAG: hypothetical protein DWQ37_06855 [Planctomycetota bacterium]